MNKIRETHIKFDYSVLENNLIYNSLNNDEKMDFAGNAVQEITSLSVENGNTEINNIVHVLLKNASKRGKYDKYISVLKSGFPYDNIEIKEVYIRHKENELWIIAERVDSEISEGFFDIAFDLWDDLYSGVNIVLVGENELDRMLLPDDLEAVDLNIKEV